MRIMYERDDTVNEALIDMLIWAQVAIGRNVIRARRPRPAHWKQSRARTPKSPRAPGRLGLSWPGTWS